MNVRPALLAALAMLAAGPAAADGVELPETGTVFFSAAERAGIEARRRALLAGEAAPAGDAAAASAADPVPTSNHHRLEGLVRRGDGRRVAWFGGERVADLTRWQGHLVRIQPGRVVLEAADGRRLTLRVGDAVDLDSGRVDSLRARR